MSKTKKEAITARVVWDRYRYMRDHGHIEYVAKANKCEDFYAGKQWDSEDLLVLREQGRPALTINKILPIVSNLLGSQVFNRTDTVFKPRNEGATAEIADALTKVFMQIGDNNDLTWVRSDVFFDGIVTSRGFFDVRLDTEDSRQGEVRIRQLNPKNVLIDPDADSYKPTRWNDVMYTEWWTADDIELRFGKEKADTVRAQYDNAVNYGEDSSQPDTDRFGSDPSRGIAEDGMLVGGQRRDIRVLDYQYRCVDLQDVLVDTRTGDVRPIPENWTDERLQTYLQNNEDIGVDKKLMKRIRWVLVAGDEVLYDEWSPYEDFTIVPYFPNFIRGRTVGIVENLISSQELLNKTSSQELHVVNTTANSGYYVKRNSLQNMSIAELEERGSSTGVVIELDDMANIQKIPSNPTPQGLDRISYKSEEHIKTISGVSDYMTGFAREDVSAKAVKANQAGGSANTAHIQDSLNRTDYLLANVILRMVQRFYTDERIIVVTADRVTGQTGQTKVNEATPEGGILNDLTLGEYSVVISNQPDRDTFEETQFDQVLSLRTEAGVQIPDKYLIQASRLKDKNDILQELQGGEQSPEQQQQEQFQLEMQQRMLQAEVMDKEASSQLKMAQAQKAMAQAQNGGGGDGDGDGMNDSIELLIAREKLAFERERLAREDELKRYEIDVRAETALTIEQMKLGEQREVRASEEASALQEKAREDRESSKKAFAEAAQAFSEKLDRESAGGTTAAAPVQQQLDQPTTEAQPTPENDQ